MAQSVLEYLDLGLAWRRASNDRHRRLFVRHPFEQKLVEFELSRWINGLSERLASGTYSPSPATVVDVPKSGWTVRPGAILTFEDRVVYAACVGACLPNIADELAWAEDKVDYSYALAKDPHTAEWVRDPFPGWKKFTEDAVAKVGAGFFHVVFSDISAYYENIDIGLLMSDLRSIDCPGPVVDLLSRCLNRWGPRGRGIPQGHTASDILGRLYLNSTDHRLLDCGHAHSRYVDDYRLFCHSIDEGKRAILDLTRFLRERSLNVQVAKTSILSTEDAIRELQGALPDIEELAAEFRLTVGKIAAQGNPYLTVASADAILSNTARPDNVPIEVIRNAFSKHFADDSQATGNASLLHFLLNRLRKQHDPHAVGRCQQLLAERPEETGALLHYLEEAGAVDDTQKTIPGLLTNLVYEFQAYQIVDWLVKNLTTPVPAVVQAIRTFAFGSSYPAYLRAVARQFLARFGSTADLERLEAAYAQAGSELERAEILCSVQRMEKNRRNAFLARAQEDGELTRRAAKLVRSGHAV